MKIGVITDCFRLNTTDAIQKAAQLELDGVQIYATTGEFSPETLTPEKKRNTRRLLKKTISLCRRCAAIWAAMVSR